MAQIAAERVAPRSRTAYCGNIEPGDSEYPRMSIEQRLTFRAAHRSEAGYIAALSRVQIEHGLHWRWTPARVRRQILDKETMVLVASDRGELCGFAIMRFGESNAHLFLLAVEPKKRRGGIGRALMRWLEKSARTAGLQHIRVEVRDSNRSALRFYGALGYRYIREVRRYYDRRESAIVLVKRLSVDDKLSRPGLA